MSVPQQPGRDCLSRLVCFSRCKPKLYFSFLKLVHRVHVFAFDCPLIGVTMPGRRAELAVISAMAKIYWSTIPITWVQVLCTASVWCPNSQTRFLNWIVTSSQPEMIIEQLVYHLPRSLKHNHSNYFHMQWFSFPAQGGGGRLAVILSPGRTTV